MFFRQKKIFNNHEINLIKDFLEKLMGKSKSYCKESAESQGFRLIDHWDNKMGFIKELKNRYYILCLHFNDKECAHYQVIVKKEDEPWIKSKMFNYDTVRDHNLV